MMSLRKLIASTALLLITTLASSLIMAGEYYRWTGEDGVTHYGSTPPQGVKAELVSTYGDGNKAPNSSAASDTTSSPVTDASIAKQQQELINTRKKECDDERKRLATLKSNGSAAK